MQAILFVGVVACFTVTANAISCYSCESVYEPASCGENFEPENYFKLDCSRLAPPRYLEKDLAFRNATACMKLVYREHGVQKISRSCFFGDVNETDIGCRMDPTLTAAATATTVDNAACYVCDTENFCNGSSELMATAAYTPALMATFFGFISLAKKLLQFIETV